MTDTSKRPYVHDILQDYSRLQRVEKLAGELTRSMVVGKHLGGLPDSVWKRFVVKAEELQAEIQKGVK